MKQFWGIGKVFTLIIFVFALILVGLWLWVKLEGPYLLPIRHVRIQGTTEAAQQAHIKKALLPLVTVGFLAVNTSAIQQRLLHFPWIATANVKRVWPDTLSIGITEQTAIATWNGKQLLNAKGDIFVPLHQAAMQNLPLITGPEGLNTLALTTLLDFDRALNSIGLTITELHLSLRRAWRITLSNGIQLHLGRIDMMQRLTRFIKIYPAVFAAKANQVDYVDLRYSNGFAVHWKPEPLA